MSAEKFVSEMREALQALTEADPYFADIPVVNERLQDIEGKLDVTIGTFGGVALLLVTPTLGGALRNVQGANFKEILFVGRVLENVTMNDTGKAALDVAIYTAALWSQARPDTFPTALVPAEPTIKLANDPKYLSYDVRFTSEGGAALDIPRLPAITADASDPAAITLAQAIPGAAIFFTTTESSGPPVPRNPLAALYTGPFAAASGTRLRARAWLAGFLPSAELTLTV